MAREAKVAYTVRVPVNVSKEIERDAKSQNISPTKAAEEALIQVYAK